MGLFSRPELKKKQQKTSKSENKKHYLGRHRQKISISIWNQNVDIAQGNVQQYFKINVEFQFEFPAKLKREIQFQFREIR